MSKASDESMHSLLALRGTVRWEDGFIGIYGNRSRWPKGWTESMKKEFDRRDKEGLPVPIYDKRGAEI